MKKVIFFVLLLIISSYSVESKKEKSSWKSSVGVSVGRFKPWSLDYMRLINPKMAIKISFLPAFSINTRNSQEQTFLNLSSGIELMRYFVDTKSGYSHIIALDLKFRIYPYLGIYYNYIYNKGLLDNTLLFDSDVIPIRRYKKSMLEGNLFAGATGIGIELLLWRVNLGLKLNYGVKAFNYDYSDLDGSGLNEYDEWVAVSGVGAAVSVSISY